MPVPIPQHLADLPTWHDLPVPTISCWAGELPETTWSWRHDEHVDRQAWFTPDWTAGDGDAVIGRQNPQRQRRSAMLYRCQVCDAEIPERRAWLVVSARATLQPVTVDGRRGKSLVVTEPWLCHPCAAFSISVCPGLIGRRRTDDLVMHRPNHWLNIMSTAYMDGPLAEEAKIVQPALWVKIAVGDGLTLAADDFLAVPVP